MPNITIFTHKNSLHSALFSHDLREVDMMDIAEWKKLFVEEKTIQSIIEAKKEDVEKFLVSLL